MKTKIWFSVFLFLTMGISMQSQHIVSYEYWFDHDIQAAVSLSATPEQFANITSSLSAEGLDMGYHTFNYRFKDDNGSYSVPITKYFVKSASDIVAYEYWFDGITSTAVAVNTPSDTWLNLAFAANTDALSNGSHTFTYRFRDLGGNYSVPVTRYFVRSGFGLNTFEYWFDDDIANRIPTSIQSTEYADLIFLASTAGLSSGTHAFLFRVKDEINNWSVPIRHEFSVVVGVEELNVKGNLLLFPNPTNDELRLMFEVNNPTYMMIEILDQTGRAVGPVTRIAAAGKMNLALESSALSPGVYHVRISSEKEFVQLPFVKN